MVPAKQKRVKNSRWNVALRLCIPLIAVSVFIISTRSRAAGKTATASPNDPIWALWPMPDSMTPYCADGTNQLDCSSTFSTSFDGEDGASIVNKPTYDTSVVGTVKDSVTGLVWQRNVDAIPRKWPDASAYCAGLTLADMSGWRLPTAIELLSIADLGRYNPAIDTETFPMPTVTGFWSSSPYARAPTYKWYLEFRSGMLADNGPNTQYSVRCVH